VRGGLPAGAGRDLRADLRGAFGILVDVDVDDDVDVGVCVGSLGIEEQEVYSSSLVVMERKGSRGEKKGVYSGEGASGSMAAQRYLVCHSAWSAIQTDQSAVIEDHSVFRPYVDFHHANFPRAGRPTVLHMFSSNLTGSPISSTTDPETCQA
jgi:hypothetical protein